uniref:Inter-alpha-trypsin inhibitor heavy chain 5 n=1 Tax=Naja naja TaxID=35670 RepID=A0A8C6X8A7_NAJNA
MFLNLGNFQRRRLQLPEFPRNYKALLAGNSGNHPTPPPSTVVGQTKTLAKITFSPNLVQQAKIARNGVLGDFIIRYDVNRELSVGEVQVLDGYFVHYFAPKDLPPLPKNIVFVLDRSASMVGTKMKQTQEALFTILHDLRPGDHFNIIGFSNEIKVWKEKQLVPVTPENIRDAIFHIHLVPPNEGTNINDALQTSAKILNDYITQNEAESRSASLLVFLTDGRPTMGETQTSKIISNLKEAIRNRFCVFTIGIGNDVNHHLLERVALENCGMMRLIREDENASNQTCLCRFYDEISTPLLSDIRVDYPMDSVEKVTQNFFPNYFNGSEIVIAGKLFNKTAHSLHVEVTASNSDKHVLLKTDVAIDLSGQNLLEASFVGPPNSSTDQNYIERAWSYLTIKELLTSWLKSDNSKEKASLRERAKNLALAYNFVMPFTTLKMKTLPFQVDALAWGGSWAMCVCVVLCNLISPLISGSISEKSEEPKINVTKTSADGDPHFVIDLPRNKLTICFNIDGQPGDILRLVSDHKHSGVTVNGQLIGAPAPRNGHKKHRTYFKSIMILSNKPGRSYLEISPTKVILDDEKRLVFPCDRNAVVVGKNFHVSIVAHANVTVVLQDSISFVILIHHYKNPARYQKNHLGFYISNGQGLSRGSHGLIGQFLHQDIELLTEPFSEKCSPDDCPETNSNSGHALQLKGHLVPVVWKQRKIYNGQQEVDCWFAKNNAEKLIDGDYTDYLASHPFDTGTSPLEENGL